MTADTRTIEELIAAIAAGEPSAFDRLHRETEARVRLTVRRSLVDPWQSEEVTQEVFLEIWQKAGSFDAARGRGITWILTMASRRAIDRVRAAQASRERELRDAERSGEQPYDQVWEAVLSRLDRDLLLDGLQRITPLQCQALTTTYLHGRTVAQAAEHLGASEKAVRTRVRDGILRLRAVIEVERAAA